jgi:hypothetical protein
MTASNNPSLIQGDNQQLKLFGSDQMDPALFLAEESGEQREYTGARLFVANPELYKAIVALSAEGLGVLRIAKILHVGPNTIMAVREREPQSVDIEKRRIAGLSREGAKMCVEGIIELLCDPVQKKKMTIKDLGIVFGILAEKHELLSGSPTARLQTIGAPAAGEVLEYMRWLRTEYERRMGCGEGKEDQRADVQPDPGPGADHNRPAIVEPGPAPRRPIALLEAPKSSVGQTTHRIDETPVNIDRNEDDQNAAKSISKAKNATA